MMQAIRKILVYVDGSGQSYAAVRMAIVLARSMHAELFALSVINTRALSDLVQAHIFLESEREEYRRDLEGDVDRHIKKVRELGRKKEVSIAAEIASGSVSAEIKNKVNQLGIDLLVLGEAPEVRSRRDEMSNETERAARMVSCSVLIAKNEDRIDEMYDAL